MPSARHRAKARPAALLRSRHLSRITGIATVVTATVVTVGLATGASDNKELVPSANDAAAAASNIDALRDSRERERVSRSAQRVAGRVALAPRPVDHEFAAEPLNVWTRPGEKGPKAGLVKAGTKLAVTGQSVGGWAEVLMAGPKDKQVVRWVNAKYLSEEKPQPETGPEAGVSSSAPCPDGSDIEGGLTSSAVVVYRAVCAAFPQPTTYGGLDPHGEHIDGRAIDIMISGEVGWQIAEYLRANAAQLQIRDIIYSQKIWTPDQASAGWRYMEDRGSVTANHYDHVHVAVY
jgi:uncharacterized protein YraI